MFYGREYELGTIKHAIASNRAELGIVYGRRRVGKSALLLQARRGRGSLFFEALERASQKRQVEHFMLQLSKQTRTPQSVARNWQEAFDVLSFHLAKGRHYVVFDEFPWMASNRTELVSLLKYYWDNRWKQNAAVTLVLCGSVAAFMLKHIVHSRALHNRKTFEIKLDPVPANEAKLFFKGYRSEFEMARFLMVFGGIPKYLEQVDPRRTFTENVDRLCFQKNGFFVTEFETVFKEQFKVTKTYERIIKSLAGASCPKEELGRRLSLPSGGGLTGYLDTLERADFIRTFTPHSVLGGGEKTRRLVLWDEWLRFYFTYMEPHLRIIELNTQPGLFEKLAGRSLDAFFGLAFEGFCMRNLPRILAHVGVKLHEVMGFGPFFRQRRRTCNPDPGLQVDILVRRRGQVLMLIECKFSTRPIGASVRAEVERKVRLLRLPRHYTVERVLIAGGEVSPALERDEYFHHILGLDAVFS